MSDKEYPWNEKHGNVWQIIPKYLGIDIQSNRDNLHMWKSAVNVNDVF